MRCVYWCAVEASELHALSAVAFPIHSKEANSMGAYGRTSLELSALKKKKTTQIVRPKYTSEHKRICCKIVEPDVIRQHKMRNNTTTLFI